MIMSIPTHGLCATSFRPLLRQPMSAVKLKTSRAFFSNPSRICYTNGMRYKISSSLSRKAYLEQSKESTELDDDGGPPRWFSPLESGSRSSGSPLLLFLPGIDGSGLGLRLHYKKLGEIFDIWCLHVAAADRTPLPDLVALVENAVKTEQDRSSSKTPTYLVGESFGASLALHVAAKNPDIDFVLILANPDTNFSKALVQSVVPLSNMFHHKLNAGLRYWMSSVPVETVLWKMKMIEEMQNYLNSHLHAIKAQTLILTSGKDMALTSITEGNRLSSMLQNSRTRTFIRNGDPLLLDEDFDLVAAIKSASYYRRGETVDYITDFLPPTPSEFKSAYEPFRWMDVGVDPVVLSTVGGKIVRGLGGIPSEGPVLLVSNHMLLGMDIVPIGFRLRFEQNINLRGMAHPFFFETKNGLLQDLPILDAVKMGGGVPLSAKNLYRLFASKSHVLLYPGGLREGLHRRGEEHRLIWPDESEFVRMAARFGAKIVPFGSVGEDDLLQLVLDCDDQMKIPFLKAKIEELTRETVRVRSDALGEIGKQTAYIPITLPKLPGRFYYFFGKPILTEGRKDVVRNKDKGRELYLEVMKETEKCIGYLKQKREKDPYRNLLVRLAYQRYHGFNSQVPTFEI